MTRALTVTCGSVEATGRVAASLAALASPGQVVVLVGGLGTGKTTFTKAYAAALGVSATVTSPSFALVHHYACGVGSPVSLLLHVDAWRLTEPSQARELGLDEPLAEGAVALIEWGDRLGTEVPGDPVVVTFRVVDEHTRELTVDLATSGLSDDALVGVGTP